MDKNNKYLSGYDIIKYGLRSNYKNNSTIEKVCKYNNLSDIEIFFQLYCREHNLVLLSNVLSDLKNVCIRHDTTSNG